MIAQQKTTTALERAIAFAVDKHAGQVDKVGRPYILHPLRVMLAQETDEARIAAVLHDVVEDCDDVEIEDVARLELPDAALETVKVLTHDDAEPYEDYIERLALNPMARNVKLADLRDNIDIARLAEVTDRDAKRLDKYIRAYRTLKGEGP